MIKPLLSTVIAIFVLIICKVFEMVTTKKKGYINYLEKVKYNRFIKLLLSLFFIFLIFYCLKGMPILDYFFLAFIIKISLYISQSAIYWVVNLYMRNRTKNTKDQNIYAADFRYMDKTALVNMVGFLPCCILYAILDIIGVLFPYSGSIGTMLMFMATTSIIKDFFSLYMEFDKRNPDSLICKIKSREWSLPDNIYLWLAYIFRFIKGVVHNKAALLIFSTYIMGYLFTFLKNMNRI